MNRVASAWKALGEQDHVPWGFQWLDADDAEHSMYSFLRWSADGTEVVACVANLTPVPREATASACPGPANGRCCSTRTPRTSAGRALAAPVPRGPVTTNLTKGSRPPPSSPSPRSPCSGWAPGRRDGRPQREGRRLGLPGARRRRRAHRRVLRGAGGGQRPERRPDLCHVGAGVHRRVAVRVRRRDRDGRLGGRRGGQRPPPGGPQRRLWPGAGAGAARSVGSPAAGRAVRDRRVDGDGDGAARSALPCGRSGGRACRSSSAGTSAP